MDLGAVFETFASFEEKLAIFSKEKNVCFTKRSSEKIKDPNLDHLKYEYLVLCCKQGTNRHGKTSAGQRKSQCSFKVGCPAKIKVVAKRGPSRLEITIAMHEHTGHQVSKEICRLYPENRKVALDDATRMLVSLNTIQTFEVRQVLEEHHDVDLLPRDIYNLKAKIQKKSSTDAAQTGKILDEISANGGCVAYGFSEDGNFKYMSYMTSDMLRALAKFPEVLLMDFTYKTNMYLYPLLTVMAIDGDGRGIPILHGFVRNEDRGSIAHCLSLLSQNCEINRIKCFIIDKDLSEISALSDQFPGIPVNLCHFHITQAVSRHLRKNVPSDQVQPILDTFMAQVHTESFSDFDAITQDMKASLPESVVEYFSTNWWSKAHLWSASANANVLKLHATTTNHLESYHAKIKKSLSHQLSFTSALQKLLMFDNSKMLLAERLRVIAANTVHYTSSENDECVNAIENGATAFAASLIISQLRASRSVQYTVNTDDKDKFKVIFKERVFLTTCTMCSCSFAVKMTLPCRHIFVVRRFLGLPEFCTQLLPTRFAKNGPPIASSFANSFVDRQCIPSLQKINTQEGRYVVAKKLCMDIANFLAVQGQKDFQDKINFLETTLRLWKCPTSMDDDPAEDQAVDAGIMENATADLGHDGESNGVEVLTTQLVDFAECTSDTASCGFEHIVLDKVRPKGRPRAKQLFTMRKRKRQLPHPYSHLSLEIRKSLILSSFVMSPNIKMPIGIDDLKPEGQFTDTVFSDSIDITIAESAFTKDAWLFIQNSMSELKKNHVFRCYECNEFDDGILKMVLCDRCLCWFHYPCVGFRTKKCVPTWFCNDCWLVS